MRTWTTVLAGVLLGSGAGATPGAGGGLLLPLPGPPVITSSFGEYRPGHYHGGLDFSTGGRDGLPVRAPASGWVYRLRASGVGYGRSIYFRLDDGRTAVFGHLSRFAPRIQHLVEAEQGRLERYEVDFQPAPETLRFERGEVLAYSGHSGAGPSHLHAELRTGPDAAVAVNPLLSGWPVPDATPPRLTRLRIAPARAGVRVNGGFDPVTLEVPADGSFSITGPVRFWVETSDYDAGGKHRLAPYEVEASVDGTPLARVAFDRLDWNWPREVEWTYQNRLARDRGQRWVCLDRPPRSRQTVTAEAGPGLELERAPGEHELRVTVRDAAGNPTEAVFPFAVDPPAGGPVTTPRVEATRLLSRGPSLELRVAGLAARAVRIRTTGPIPGEAVPTWISVDAPGGCVFQLQGDDSTATGLWRFEATSGDSLLLAAQAVRLGRRRAAGGAVDAGGIRLEPDADCAYRPMWITVETGGRTKATERPELVPVSASLRLEPRDEPLRARLAVRVPPPAGEDRRGLALMSRDDGTWSFEGADTAGAGVGAQLARLATVALFRDETPPRVTWIHPAGHAPRTLVARIRDAGVGVTWTGLHMHLNGRVVIAEWDPEAGRLTGFLRSPLEPGDYVVSVQASDRVGNRVTESLTFTVH